MDLPLPLELKIKILSYFTTEDIIFCMKHDVNTSIIFCEYFPVRSLIAIIISNNNQYIDFISYNTIIDNCNKLSRLCFLYNNIEIFRYFVFFGANIISDMKYYIDTNNTDFVDFITMYDVEFTTNDLIYAINNNKDKIVEYYIQKYNKEDFSNIIFVVHNISVEVMNLIFPYLINLDILNLCVVKKFSIDVIKYCLDRETYITLSAVDSALTMQREDVIIEFILRGFDIHYKCDKFLRWSCKHGYSKLLKLLIEKNVVTVSNSMIPIINAIKNSHCQIVKLLCETQQIYCTDELLVRLFMPSKYSYIKYFVSNNIQIILPYGIAHNIIKYDDTLNLKLIESNGFDIRNNDDIIFNVACKNNYINVVKYYVSKYNDLNIKKGLLLSLQHGSLCVFNELYKINNSVDLDTAIKFGNYYVVSKLLNTEQVSRKHLTHAITSGNINILKLLLTKCTDINENCIYYIINSNNMELLKTIMPYIKDIDIENLKNFKLNNTLDYLIRNSDKIYPC